MYGADAVAGVSNFILRRNFEGVELSGSFGQSGESDADRIRADLTLGSNVADGRGNVVISLGYSQVDPLNQDQRPIGVAAISATTGLPSGSATASCSRVSRVMSRASCRPST